MTELLGDGWKGLPGLSIQYVIQATFADDDIEARIISDSLADATIHVAYRDAEHTYVLYEKDGHLYEVLDYESDYLGNRDSPVWYPAEASCHELSVNASEWFDKPYGRAIARAIWNRLDAS